MGHRHNDPNPFHDKGKVLGDEGARWSFITNTMVQIYNAKCYCANFTNAITKQTLQEGMKLILDSVSLMTYQHNKCNTPL